MAHQHSRHNETTCDIEVTPALKERDLLWQRPFPLVFCVVHRSYRLSCHHSRRQCSQMPRRHRSSSSSRLERFWFGDRRRLSDKKKRSAIHGTNGYLVPLHSTNELLGLAHFHRPEHRDSSDYARHGHHYSKCIYYFNFFLKIISMTIHWSSFQHMLFLR